MVSSSLQTQHAEKEVKKQLSRGNLLLLLVSNAIRAVTHGVQSINTTFYVILAVVVLLGILIVAFCGGKFSFFYNPKTGQTGFDFKQEMDEDSLGAHTRRYQ